jgi:oligosaccharide repeat unit polymerase
LLGVAIIIITLLAVFNYRIGGKAAFFPSVVFCLVWAADLLVLQLGGSFFYPISPPTLAIFVCGCLVFSIGSWLGVLWPIKTSPSGNGLPEISNRILTLVLIGILLAIPIVLRWLMQLSADKGGNFLAAIYQVLSVEENQAEFEASLFLNLASFSSIVAMVAFYEKPRGKWRAAIAVLSALALNVMGGGRTGFTTLIPALICLDWLRNRRLRWKLAIAMALLLLILSSSVVFFVQKGDVRTDASLGENIVPIAQTFASYGAGGLVAFDRVVREPNIVEHNWQIDRFFLQTLNKFGTHFRVPLINANFVTIGPNQNMQNIYTFYFAYLDLGYLGMMMVILLVAFVVTLIYRKAIAGSPVAALMYAPLFSGVMLSIYFEPFLIPLNFLFKLWVFVVLIYGLPVAWAKLNKIMARSVAGEIARNGSL